MGRWSKNKGGRHAVVKFIEEHNRKKNVFPQVEVRGSDNNYSFICWSAPVPSPLYSQQC